MAKVTWNFTTLQSTPQENAKLKCSKNIVFYSNRAQQTVSLKFKGCRIYTWRVSSFLTAHQHN